MSNNEADYDHAAWRRETARKDANGKAACQLAKEAHEWMVLGTDHASIFEDDGVSEVFFEQAGWRLQAVIDAITEEDEEDEGGDSGTAGSGGDGATGGD